MHLQDNYMRNIHVICRFSEMRCYVHADRMDQWLQVKPNILSDKEDCGGKFKVRQKEWRSASFNELMDTLDRVMFNFAFKQDVGV